MKNIFNINISTYIFYFLLILSGYIKYLIFYLMIIFTHEIGHLILIKLLKYKINKINIYPFGGIIETNININIKSIHLFLISISGVLFQIILFVLIKNPIFLKLNLYIIIYNLLPIYPLDGYKIWLSIFENITYYNLIIKIFYFISMLFLFIFFVFTKNIIIFILLYSFNIKYILFHKYYMNKFYLERYIYKNNYYKIKYVNQLNKIYKNKFNYINYVNEFDYLKNHFNMVLY